MAKKRKLSASSAQQSEEQKPKLVEKIESSEEEEEEASEEEVEEEVEEETEESESESEEEEEEAEEQEEEDEVEEEYEEEEEEEEEETSDEEEDDSEESKRITLRKLLEPFGKEQIIDFLKDAALNNPSIADQIIQTAESDPSNRKIFVHGLGWDATHDQVFSIFKQYGELEDCRVVTDKATGRAKGYAFILFKTRRGALKALKEPQKKIGHRVTSCQLASAGPVTPDALQSRKIYVGNVAPHVNPDRLRHFFAQFGEIDDGPFGIDTATGKFKGYALLTYKTSEGCKKALEEPEKLFEGCQLQCRRATTDAAKGNKNSASVIGTPPGGATPAIQQSEVNPLHFGMGVNPGIIGANFNPAAALLVGQNAGVGMGNSIITSYNKHQTALSHPVAPGLAHPSLGFNSNFGINSISPSVIGSYGPQAALQGLGAYQGVQMGHSSSGATPTTAIATRTPSGFGHVGTSFPSSFNR